MTTEVTQKQKPRLHVVATKVDSPTFDHIEKTVKETDFKNKAEYLKAIINDAKNNGINKDEKSKVVSENPKPEIQPTECNLSDESLLVIANVVRMVLVNSSSAPIVLSPDREHLRKLSGREPQFEGTLTVEEEEYLASLTDAIKADVTETLLLEKNSVPIPHEKGIKQRMFEDMVKKRNEVVSEKLPSLTHVFQTAISQAFFDDCRSLYNRNLFKATYGMDYDEFKAVFLED